MFKRTRIRYHNWRARAAEFDIYSREHHLGKVVDISKKALEGKRHFKKFYRDKLADARAGLKGY